MLPIRLVRCASACFLLAGLHGGPFACGQDRASQPVDETELAKIRDAIKANDVPIRFAGKVVDQAGKAVAGAKVLASVRQYSPEEELFMATRPVAVATDNDGVFRIENVVGSLLFVQTIEKEGYEFALTSNPVRGFDYSPISVRPFVPDEAHPVIFHLRSKGPGTMLVEFGAGFYVVSLKPEQTRVGLDFLAPQRQDRILGTSRPTGNYKYDFDLEIRADYSQQDNRYKVIISAPRRMDGFVVSDQLLYEAPAVGYEKEHTVTVDPSLKTRQPIYLYVRSRSPNLYTRLELVFVSSKDRLNMEYRGWINPYGDRNLEFETDLTLTPSLYVRLMREYREALRKGERIEKPDLPRLIQAEKAKPPKRLMRASRPSR